MRTLTSLPVMFIGHGGRPGIGNLLNILLPLAAGATVHAVGVLSSFPSIPAVALCLFSLVEPSCLSAGQPPSPSSIKMQKTIIIAWFYWKQASFKREWAENRVPCRLSLHRTVGIASTRHLGEACLSGPVKTTCSSLCVLASVSICGNINWEHTGKQSHLQLACIVTMVGKQ